MSVSTQARRVPPPALEADEPHYSSPYDYLETHGFRLRTLSDPAGTVAFPGGPNAVIAMHIGTPVEIACRRDGARHSGLAVFGTLDIIPPETPSVWTNAGRDLVLSLGLSPRLLGSVAEQLDLDPRRVEIRNRFQVRDPQIEHLVLALVAELESGAPCGRLYLDSLAVSISVRLLRAHSSAARVAAAPRLGDRRLRRVLGYIEENLAEELTLAGLADVAGLSVSHLTTVFREELDSSVHQYVIRRRVECARALIEKGELPLSHIALESGFSHQSHLARHMRRLLGVTPAELRRVR